MILTLVRKKLTPQSTLGELSVDGKFLCYTLEDCVRKEKIKGQTAIPAGRYRVVVTWSQRFQRYLPLVLNVPNFEGVRIHTGNTDKDTEGCILVGQLRGIDSVGQSRLAFAKLFSLIEAAQREDVFIEIK